jgi:hypothetical protein
MIKNLSHYQDFEFLQYVDVFGRNHKVDLLIEIAVELQFQFKTLTPEYLKYYIINRCNDEIGISLAVEDYPLYRLYKTQDDDKLTSELRDYKLRVLNELIPLDEDRLRLMKKERKDLKIRMK